MRNGAGIKKLVILLALLFLSSAVRAQSAAGDKCTEAPEFYERGSYTIHEVKIDSPLGWLFGSVDQKLKDITSDPEMPIKKGQAFRKADSDAGFIKVQEKFPELTVSRVDRIAVRIARPTLQQCDAQAKTLDVVYRVYSIGFSYYLSRAFETGQKEEVKRSSWIRLRRKPWPTISATICWVRSFPQTPMGGRSLLSNSLVGCWIRSQSTVLVPPEARKAMPKLRELRTSKAG